VAQLKQDFEKSDFPIPPPGGDSWLVHKRREGFIEYAYFTSRTHVFHHTTSLINFY